MIFCYAHKLVLHSAIIRKASSLIRWKHTEIHSQTLHRETLKHTGDVSFKSLPWSSVNPMEKEAEGVGETDDIEDARKTRFSKATESHRD